MERCCDKCYYVSGHGAGIISVCMDPKCRFCHKRHELAAKAMQEPPEE